MKTRIRKNACYSIRCTSVLPSAIDGINCRETPADEYINLLVFNQRSTLSMMEKTRIFLIE